VLYTAITLLMSASSESATSATEAAKA
jgi:hypothetical protein